jgi:hypothetical protein
MRRAVPTRRVVSTATAAWLAACGSPSPAMVPSPGTVDGTYDFTASVTTPGGGLWFEGSFVVVSDTVLLDVKGADCFPYQGGTETIDYRCPGHFGNSSAKQTVTQLIFGFWREHPLHRPTLVVYMNSQSTRTSCLQYATNPDGTRTCVRQSTEIVEVPSSRSAVLKIVPPR